MSMETNKPAQIGGDYYSKKPAPQFERVARIEGQSNFLSLLAGVEAGPDTTQDMGALAFARGRGATPEALEAYVAKSVLYRLPLMSMAFMAVMRAYGPAEKEWPWIQGAVADAFMEMRGGRCKPAGDRAKHFGVRKDAYAAMRKFASRFFDDLVAAARAAYSAAMRREPDSPGYRHSETGMGVNFACEDIRRANGCFVARPFTSSDSTELDPMDTRGIGIVDNTAYDARNDRPGPVLTLHGEEAEEHCRNHPAQSFRPHSL